MAEDTLPLPEPVHLYHDAVAKKSELLYTADQLRAYAAQAVAQERERCAAICEEHYSIEGIAQNIAAAIRAAAPQPPSAPPPSAGEETKP
jgi:hypothetical protein